MECASSRRCDFMLNQKAFTQSTWTQQWEKIASLAFSHNVIHSMEFRSFVWFACTLNHILSGIPPLWVTAMHNVHTAHCLYFSFHIFRLLNPYRGVRCAFVSMDRMRSAGLNTEWIVICALLALIVQWRERWERISRGKPRVRAAVVCLS